MVDFEALRRPRPPATRRATRAAVALLFLVLSACGSAPASSSLHLPQSIDGNPAEGVRRGWGFGNDMNLPAVEGGYGPYNLLLIDLPIRSTRLMRALGFGTVPGALRDLARPERFYGTLEATSARMGAAVYDSRDGVRYGCAPIRFADGKATICAWADRRTFAAMLLDPRGQGDVPPLSAVLATMEQVHRDSTSGPAGPCSFPACGPRPVRTPPSAGFPTALITISPSPTFLPTPMTPPGTPSPTSLRTTVAG